MSSVNPDYTRVMELLAECAENIRQAQQAANLAALNARLACEYWEEAALFNLKVQEARLKMLTEVL